MTAGLGMLEEEDILEVGHLRVAKARRTNRTCFLTVTPGSQKSNGMCIIYLQTLKTREHLA